MSSERIVDIGGGTPWKTGWIHEKYGNILDKKGYCLDYDISAKPHIVARADHIPFRNKSVDGVICNSVLEHVPEPRGVVDEIFRILKPGGKCYGSTPWIYPYHPCTKDYWRFSEDGLRYLFISFKKVEIFPSYEGSIKGSISAFLSEAGYRGLSNKAGAIAIVIEKLLVLLFATRRGEKYKDPAQRFVDFIYRKNNYFSSFFAVK